MVVADTSTWIEMHKLSTAPQHLNRFQAAIRNRQIFSSPVVRLELYKGVRSQAELDDTDARLSVAEELPMVPAIAQIGVDAVRALATEGASGFHQIPVSDVLVAATASAHKMGVLTVDWTDYGKLAQVLGIALFHPLKPSTYYLP
jgi:predicted nucleic acid-binding protein